MRIAIDIDSTLHHYWDQFEAVVERLHGVALPYEGQTGWEIEGLEPDQIRAAVRETHSDRMIGAARPYDGAAQVVAGWHSAGHFIHITSHREGAAHAATSTWLQAIGLPHDELYCSFDKISRCREIGIDLLVDDSPVNLLAGIEQGIAGATITHPWNAPLVQRGAVIGAPDWPRLGAALEPLLGAGAASAQRT